MENMYIISFNSTHHAIRTEKLLGDAGLKILIIPTPREIAASCGLSIKFEFEKLDLINQIMKDNGLDRRGIYNIVKDKDGNRQAIKLED